MTKIKPFINKYNRDLINFSSEKDHIKKMLKKNVTFALNILYAKKEKNNPAYASNYNSNHEKQTKKNGIIL